MLQFTNLENFLFKIILENIDKYKCIQYNSKVTWGRKGFDILLEKQIASSGFSLAT